MNVAMRLTTIREGPFYRFDSFKKQRLSVLTRTHLMNIEQDILLHK